MILNIPEEILFWLSVQYFSNTHKSSHKNQTDN